MTDEKMPPHGAAGGEDGAVMGGQGTFGLPSHGAQARLVSALYALDGAYERAVRAARVAGERSLFAQLDARWQAYEALVQPVLGAGAQPAKLFE